jgi:hypothetical protein
MTTLVALLAALLGFGSCATMAPRNDVKQLVEGGTCPGAMDADVDGDGRADRVVHRLVDARPFLEVCFADGSYVQMESHGSANALLLADLDHDGTTEVLAGDDKGWGQTFALYAWDGNSLHDTGIVLKNGKAAPGDETPRFLFGCDAPNHVRQYDFDWQHRAVNVTSYTLRGGAVSTAFSFEPMPEGAKHGTYEPTRVHQCVLRGGTP